MTASSGDGDGAAEGLHPPRCRVVFHVGVTGHRALPDAGRQKLSETVADVLAEVRSCAAGIAAGSLAGEEPLIRNDPPHFRLFSSLAAGADSLAAELALEQGYELQASFPFPRKVYAGDFQGEDAARWKALTAQASAVLELDGDRDHAGHAYLAAGRVVLDQSDLLIAVWDGKEARGIGGTEQIVEEAIERRLPVLVIDAFAPHAVHFLNPATQDWRGTLRQEMARILAPFAENSDRSGFPWVYFRETGVDARDRSGIAAAGKWTDELAKRYALRYRMAALFRYIFGALVILGTFIGFYFDKPHQPWGFGLQAVAVIAILLLTHINARAKWHRKMVDYRFLAEHLRHCPSMAALGYVLPAARYPAHQAGEEASWVNWHFRGLNRLRGLPDGVLDVANLIALRGDAYARIVSQKNWYQSKSEHCRRLAKALTVAGLVTFVSGLIITALRPVGFALTAWADPALIAEISKMLVPADVLRLRLNEIALVLPALAPIFFGLLSLAEYSRMAERYGAMADYLEDAGEEFAKTEPSRRRLLPRLVSITGVMLAEVSDWRVLIKSKTLPRP
jgi:hypothetical protein